MGLRLVHPGGNVLIFQQLPMSIELGINKLLRG
jgi:hypothetical protein